MSPSRAMIMAAGLGARMGPITRTIPKPLLKARGRALIDHALDRVAEGGAGEAVVNLHHLGPMIREHLAGRERPRVLFSDEADALLDTGGGVRKARPLLGEAPVYVLNSDAIWTGAAPLPALAAAWDEDRMDGLLHLVRREDAAAYTRAGDFFLDDAGRPVRRGTAESAPYIYASAQIIRPSAFEGMPEGAFSTNLVWDRLIAAGRLFAVVHEGGWVDVGTLEGLAAAEAALEADGR